MKKKKIANFIMVMIILVIAAAGVLGVGHVQGWFDNAEDQALLTDIKGIVNMEREGIVYTAEGDTVLRAGDQLTCTSGAIATIRLDENNWITVGEDAAWEITDPSLDSFAAEVTAGEAVVFANGKSISLRFDGKEVVVDGAVAALSVRAGAQTVSIYAGTVDGKEQGKILDWVGQERNVGKLSISSLNEFNIAQMRAANQYTAACFTDEELDQLVADRQAAMAAILADPNADPEHSCTIAIYCDTILDNWDGLEPAKAGYVPADGCILQPITVAFEDGETVFDVLTRVCTAYGIQIEYSWTPLYDSYYIEGINNLYEFDCGAESGWMYKVNEWFPNYGCSAYELQGGENIVWCYTCVGLGADVGDVWMGE